MLVLYSNNRLVPGNVEVDRGLRAALTPASERTVVTYSEFLDEPDFGGPEYEANVARYLREKYSARPPDAIVGVSNEAFDFLLRHRGGALPRHSAGPCGGGDDLPASRSLHCPPMLSACRGTTILWARSSRHCAGIRLPRRVVLVTGASERDNVWETRLRKEIPPIART